MLSMKCSVIVNCFLMLLCPFSAYSSLEWWQDGVIYQVFPRSFKDSDGDGIGDLKGIEENADYFKDLNVAAIWLSPIFESPMVDFGYDVSDFYNVAKIFGSMEDFRSLKRKLDSLDIKLILDFVPNHTSNESEWFKKSVDRIDPYTNYYVWKGPSGWNGSVPLPPNNWVSVFNGPAWEYNEKRGQFYLHQFTVQQPDLNFRNERLFKEIEKVLKFWLDEGVDGFRMDSVAYLLEHPEFPNEPKNEAFTLDIITHDSVVHLYSKDWHENYYLVNRFEKIVDSYVEKDGKPRVVINEAYSSFEYTIKYYGVPCGRHMPFNFFLITDLNDHSKAPEFLNVIRRWIEHTPNSCWPNWVIGNHDNSRVASRLNPELVDGMNMINLLLPGTAFTYYGDEIGMTDTLLRWDQTVDPGALNAGFAHFKKMSRDPARTPFQWDSSTSAGFSSNPITWLPTNPNYWWLNLEAQKRASRSHYHVYKRLVKLRHHPTFRYGKLNLYALSTWVLAFTRELHDKDTFIVIINLGSEEASVVLGREIKSLPSTVVVHTSSVNSEYEIGDRFRTDGEGMEMRPKSALVLTTGSVEYKEEDGLFSTFFKYLENAFIKMLKFIS